MAYTKQTWADLPSKTTPINANRLTHIEDGIFNAAATADNAASTAGTAAANVGIVSGKVETLTERVNGLDTAVSNKVDKVANKGLSTNDYDDTDKGKVDSLGTASTKNSTSVVTQSTDLVESGAVKDIVGWGNKNFYIGSPSFDGYINRNSYALESETYNGHEVISKSTAWEGAQYPIALKAGVTYTFSAMVKNANTSSVWIYATASIDRFSKNYTVGTDWTRIEFSFTPTVDAVFNIRVESASTTKIYLSEYQLEVGSTATAYEPYHASVDESKADNSVIAPTENGTTIQKSGGYAVGSHAIRNRQFITWKNAKAQGETINDASDYTSGDVADEFKPSDITGDCTFAQDISYITKAIKKVNNVVHIYLRFTTPSTQTANKTLMSVASLPFMASGETFFCLGALLKKWSGESSGTVNITANGEVVMNEYAVSTEVVCNLSYICL